MSVVELVILGFTMLVPVVIWALNPPLPPRVNLQQGDNLGLGLGLWLGLGFAIQAIIFVVFLNDLPRGMEKHALIPVISAVASALTNAFIFESGKVGVRTFFAVSSIALAYYALISL
jgi:uncharacterized membrane protein